MNLVFIIPLKHAGLSLAIGLGACLNAGLLLYQLRKRAFISRRTTGALCPPLAAGGAGDGRGAAGAELGVAV